MAELLFKELSEKVIGMAFSVHNILVTRCLFLTSFGPNTENPPDSPQPFERQRVYPLHYKGELVGAYIADLVVDNKIILELKSVSALNQVMEAQIINYLRLSKIPIGYLLNFNGLKVQWRRFVFEPG